MKIQRFLQRQNSRAALDATMLLLLILLLTGGPTAVKTARMIHEWAGIALLASAILHTVWNRRWYAALFRGEYSAKRVLLTVSDLALVIFFLLMMVSSPLISQYVFSFLHLHGTSFGRLLHMLSTAWAFLLTGFHLGLHQNGTYKNIPAYLLEAGGAVSFIHLRLWERLFLITEFVYTPNVPVWIQTLEYCLVLLLFVFIGKASGKSIHIH